MGQSFSAPTLTEKNLPDQTGKVFIVTGASGGVGLELAQILHSHNARVYIAARNPEKVDSAIGHIKSQNPNSKGELIYLHLDLDDLTTIKASAQEFLSREKKLDVLWNNAGVMVPPQGSQTLQGYEKQLGTNCVAPFLFTKLLTPLLVETAKTASPGSVRVVWVASSAASIMSPQGGVVMDNLSYEKDQSAMHKYGVSKAGNILHASEYGRRHGPEGILSMSLDPGNLKTDLQKNMPTWQRIIIEQVLLKKPIWGAYTELFGGLSPDLTMANQGTFAGPWGKIQNPRADIALSCKSVEDGGTGVAEQFWEWTEKQVARYL